MPEIKVIKKKSESKPASGKAGPSEMQEERLIAHFHPTSPIAEAYRSFRTNIRFTDIQETPLMFLISSAVKGEGKTTTTANLATVIAQIGKRVILLDADFRDPMVHNVFGLAGQPGVTNVIGGGSEIKDVIRPSGIENLDVVCAGSIPPNPSELMSSTRLREFLKEIGKKYDYVLIDTPPIVAVTDAAILSQFVHGVFLVVRAGSTHKKVFNRAIDLFRKVNARVFGVVINSVTAQRGYGYGHEYRYGYDLNVKKK